MSVTRGVLGLKHVVEAVHIPKLVSSTISHCDTLYNTLKSNPSETRDSLKILDSISNELCLALDPLSALSNVHSDSLFQQESFKGIQELQSYMGSLNNTPEIYHLLIRMQENEKLQESLTEEEKEIINSSIIELQNWSAPHLSEDQRYENERLQMSIFDSEQVFSELCHKYDESSTIIAPKPPKKVTSMNEKQQRENNQTEINDKTNITESEILSDNESVSDGDLIEINPYTLGIGLKNWTPYNKRKELFEKFHGSDFDERLKELQRLRELRHSMAINLGYKSFSEYKSVSSLKKDLSMIESILYSYTLDIEENTIKEANELKNIKSKFSINNNNDNSIYAQDNLFTKNLCYLNNLSQNKVLQKFDSTLTGFLSYNNVMLSLIRIMDLCFDLFMEKVPFNDNEIWISDSNDINKVSKYIIKKKSNDDLIGIIYFDLFNRKNKDNQQTITYPIFCSINDKNNKQIPSVLLSLNWDYKEKLNDSQHINLYMYCKNLLHEFGHCLSYLLSFNNNYQTLSGIRSSCYEYREFTSSFFELFGYNEYFIKYIIMDDNANISDINDISKLNKILTDLKFLPYHNLHKMEQIYHSLFDLALFGDRNRQQQSITELFNEIYTPLMYYLVDNKTDKNNISNVINEMLNGYLMKISRYIHFVDYPSNYYCYLLSEKLAQESFGNTFGLINNSNSNNFENYRNNMRIYGKHMQQCIFNHGSTKDPALCIHEFNHFKDKPSDAYMK